MRHWRRAWRRRTEGLMALLGCLRWRPRCWRGRAAFRPAGCIDHRRRWTPAPGWPHPREGDTEFRPRGPERLRRTTAAFFGDLRRHDPAMRWCAAAVTTRSARCSGRNRRRRLQPDLSALAGAVAAAAPRGDPRAWGGDAACAPPLRRVARAGETVGMCCRATESANSTATANWPPSTGNGCAPVSGPVNKPEDEHLHRGPARPQRGRRRHPVGRRRQGKMVDWLTDHAQGVVRSRAATTPGTRWSSAAKTALQLIPSGIMRPA